jgi:imidazolonepropionase
MSVTWHASARVVTCDPARPGPLGVVEDGVVGLDGDRIAFVGPRADAPADTSFVEHGERAITPGLVDAHTHACWAGSRHDEYAARMAGADYRAIARAGGGIVATHREVARTPKEELASALAARLRRMLEAGVTTVEVKSGYGLEPDHEMKQLQAIAMASQLEELPAAVPTLLALHALPQAFAADRAAYLARVARELVPAVAESRLARFVDAYIDESAFRADEVAPVLQAAVSAGLGVRLHVGQFADVGGAELASAFHAASVDHLEHVSEGGIAALARAGTRAVLLPVASFTLGQAPPPVQALRDAGVPLVVATDANPGTAPTESLPLALALAVRLYGLTPEEAIVGATREAAASLGLTDRGVLRAGLRADVVVWDLPHERALIQPWGIAKTRRVVVAGRNCGTRAADGMA